jgi:hypothetical protein
MTECMKAVMQLHFKKPVTNPVLRISDARGALVRELPIPATKNVAGIQTVCWDQRVEPIRDGNAPAAGGRGGGGGGSGFGGRGGGGGGPQGPQVVPGTNTVALVVDGKTVESKPLTIVQDPMVTLTGAERAAWNATAMELHTAQQAGTDLAAKLNTLNTEVRKAKATLDSMPGASAEVKAQFDAFQKEFDAFRPKLGVGVPAFGGGFGGGGFGGGGAAANAVPNALAAVTRAKGNLIGEWVMPSEGQSKQATSAMQSLTAAMTEGQAILTKARAVSAALQGVGVTMVVPAGM